VTVRQEWRGSPNYNGRPVGVRVDTLLLHADASKSVVPSISWCQTPKPKNPKPVSYHAIVGRTGIIYGLVEPQNRAWHAGVSAYDGHGDVNDFSIGLCFSNDQIGERFTDAAIEAGAWYAALLMRAFTRITLDRFPYHSEVALPIGRKHDPGPLFPRTPFMLLVQQFLDHPETSP
jgi:N-acetyl-anhydromuramyl-L-alanine amidase AmpD